MTLILLVSLVSNSVVFNLRAANMIKHPIRYFNNKEVRAAIYCSTKKQIKRPESPDTFIYR